MKKFAVLGVVLCSGIAAIAASTTIDSENTMGVLRVEVSPTEPMLVPVPWTKLATADEPMTAEELVFAPFVRRDKLDVYDTASALYWGWSWGRNACWEAPSGQSVAISDFVAKRGMAFWFSSGNTDTAYVIGQLPETVATSSVVKGTEAAPAYNAFCNPLLTEFDVTKITGCANKDQLMNLADGVTYEYSSALQAWTYTKFVTKWGKTTSQQVAVESLKIAPGGAFWYISRGGQPTFEWK